MSVVHQGSGAEASWKCDWGQQPAERVLQDIKAWRGLEQRLREIQQQLDVLDQSQEMTVSLELLLWSMYTEAAKVTRVKKTKTGGLHLAPSALPNVHNPFA